jgi:cardiolipin synthase
VFGAGAAAALVHRFADVVRGSPVLAVSDGDGSLHTSSPDFARRAGALSETTLSGGHSVEVLLDDGFFEPMLSDLASATESVTVLGYYCFEGVMGDRIAEVLAERARAGVRVLFLGDGFGCRNLLRSIREPLRAAGASVAAFRPVRWYSLHRAQHRMHARSVIVDGRIGYTGGFGIDDKWISDRPDDPMWRETTVRFTGPAVAQMQATFLGAWAEATGDLLTGEEFFPVSGEGEQGTATAGLLYSRPGLGPTTAERFLAITIASAERTLFISNSYFVPMPLMRELLVDAAVRGVDVRLLVPGERTDIPSTRWAGRGFYEELLTAGVRVFEYQPAMMHAKTLVADGAWVAVGSLNFDNRSIRLNDESALLILDRQVGARMDSVFLQDLERAQEITLQGHARRSAMERMLELLTRLVAPLL